MANGNRASYAKIGFCVALGVAAIVAVFIYLGGVSGDRDVIFAETYYDKSVSGLSVGSTVNFRGVKVGEVREISFVGNVYPVEGMDNQRIYILMAFPRKMLVSKVHEGMDVDAALDGLIAKGLRATVTASGITGLSRIEIDFQPRANPAPAITWFPQHHYIPPALSMLDNFSDSATKVMNQINSIDISTVWSNIHATVESLAQMSDSVKVMVESRQADLEKFLGNVSEAANSVRELVNEVKENPAILLRERQPERLPETER